MKHFLTVTTFFIFLGLHTYVLHAQNTNNSDSTTTEIDFFRKYPDLYRKYGFFANPEDYWELLSDNVHTQIEAGGNFNTPDEYIQSVWASPFRWNTIYHNNFSISSVFNPGSTLHKLKLYNKTHIVDDYNYQFNFNDNLSDTSRFISVNQTIGNAGGRIWGANWFVNNIVGHSSSYDRIIIDFDHRRSVPLMTSVYFQDGKKKDVKTSFALDFGKRRHLNFGLRGIEKPFDENFVLANFQRAKMVDNGSNHILTSFKFRDHLFAEYNYNENETAKEIVFNQTWYQKKQIDNWDLNYGANLSFRNQQMNQKDIFRNLIDLDGESFEPYHPNFSLLEAQIQSNGRYELNTNTQFFYQANADFVHFMPMDNNSQWNLFARDTSGNYNQYYQYKPESSSFTGFLPKNRIGIDHKRNFGKIPVRAEIALFQSSLLSQNVRLNDFSVDWKLHTRFPLSEKTSLYLNIGKRSMGYSFYQMQFLEKNYMSGNFNQWDDAADINPVVYDNNAQISYSKDLSFQKAYYLEIPFEYISRNGSKTNHWSILPQIRSFRDTWWVTFDGDKTDYGHFDSEGTYHLTKNPKYRVIPFPKEIMNQFGGDNWLLDQPFYTGVTLKYAYESPKVYTSASLFTYLAMGMGTKGNGVLSNSVGSLSTSSANPNNLIESLGRSHPDRSIIFRFNLMKKVNERFQYGITAKYKDGESFSTFLYQQNPKEFIVYNEGLPGDNPFYGGRDKREDAYYSIDAQLRYTFMVNNKPLILHIRGYNLLDLGLEIGEYTFRPFTDSPEYPEYDNNSRAALEVQTPRTFEIGLNYQF
jgi:hypothetical protein